jgi:hypothetical protein
MAEPQEVTWRCMRLCGNSTLEYLGLNTNPWVITVHVPMRAFCEEAEVVPASLASSDSILPSFYSIPNFHTSSLTLRTRRRSDGAHAPREHAEGLQSVPKLPNMQATCVENEGHQCEGSATRVPRGSST